MTWNLMCRSKNTLKIQSAHGWHADAMNAQFAHSKTDQAGATACSAQATHLCKYQDAGDLRIVVIWALQEYVSRFKG
jgi:hypothetical protein